MHCHEAAALYACMRLSMPDGGVRAKLAAGCRRREAHPFHLHPGVCYYYLGYARLSGVRCCVTVFGLTAVSQCSCLGVPTSRHLLSGFECLV